MVTARGVKKGSHMKSMKPRVDGFEVRVLEFGVPRCRVHGVGLRVEGVQGYLAHNKTPTPLGPPQDPRHRPTVGS